MHFTGNLPDISRLPPNLRGTPARKHELSLVLGRERKGGDHVSDRATQR
jgi:hypothetical protein